MVYIMVYVNIRTQIYLTDEQKRALKSRAQAEHRPMADLIREAIDDYLGRRRERDRARVLAESFGSMPDLEVPPRSEWDRGYG